MLLKRAVKVDRPLYFLYVNVCIYTSSSEPQKNSFSSNPYQCAKESFDDILLNSDTPQPLSRGEFYESKRIDFWLCYMRMCVRSIEPILLWTDTPQPSQEGSFTNQRELIFGCAICECVLESFEPILLWTDTPPLKRGVLRIKEN